MNEYAAKLNLVRPTYNTYKQEGLVCAFVSSMVFKGTSYTGDATRNKKDAEQLAARAAILSILGNPGSRTVLIEMIKSKPNFYDAVKSNGLKLIYASGMVPTENIGHTSVMPDHEDKVVAGPVADNNNETKIEFPESCRIISSSQEFQMPKHESAPEAPSLPNVSLQPVLSHPIDDGSSSKQKRKRRKARR